MAGGDIDQGELTQFEIEIAKELGKRGFETLLSGDTLNFEEIKTKRKGKADLVTFFKVYKQGKKIEEVADQMIGYMDKVAPVTSAAGRFNAAAPPGTKPEISLDNLYPIVKGLGFLIAYNKSLEAQFGKNIPPDHPSVPKVFRCAPDHDSYIFCGFDIGSGYTYLMNKVFAGFNISERELLNKMMDNLARRIDGYVREKRFNHLKQMEGVFSISFPDDMAASFLLIANRHFGLLEEITGAKGAEFFYGFTVTSGEIMICTPSCGQDTIRIVADNIRSRQMELSKRAEVHQIVQIDPLIITRERVIYPNVRQPSPRR